MGRWADHHRKGITFTSLRKSEIRSYRNGSLVFYVLLGHGSGGADLTQRTLASVGNELREAELTAVTPL